MNMYFADEFESEWSSFWAETADFTAKHGNFGRNTQCGSCKDKSCHDQGTKDQARALEGFSTSVWFCCYRGWEDHAIYLPPHAVQPGVLVFALAFSLHLLCQPFQADCYAAWGWISCQEGQACQARILLILFSVIIEELPASWWWAGWANLHTCPQFGITPLFPNQPLFAGSVLGKG